MTSRPMSSSAAGSGTSRMLEDDVLGAGIGQLAEPVDDLGRRLGAGAAVAEMRTFWRVERSISSGSRPTAAQCSARIAYLRAMPSGVPKTLHGVGVLGHEAQGLLLAAAADHDRHPGA